MTITGDSTLVYLKNNDDKSFILTGVALGAFDGITHSDAPYITLVRNPSGGDLITDATSVDMNQNRNFGSSQNANANIYKGKVGGTLTGGDNIAFLQTNKTGRSFFGIDFLLPKGSSIGVKLNANVTSGTASYYCALIGYFKDEIDAQ